MFENKFFSSPETSLPPTEHDKVVRMEQASSISSSPETARKMAADAVEASWERCRELGLHSDQVPGCGIVEPQELELLRNKHAGLITLAENEVLPCFDNMLENTRCLVAFATADGAILQTWQPTGQSLSGFETIVPGSLWDEATAGTNAIGTSLSNRHGVHIRGNQHFLRANHHLMGAATPIFDARNRLIGILSLFSTSRQSGDYSLGMVKLLSHGIENSLIFRAYQENSYILKINTSAPSLDSNWAGLLVLNYEGTILAANRRAKTMLGDALLDSHLSQVFDVTLDSLSATATERPVRLQASGNYHLFVQLLLPQISSSARKASTRESLATSRDNKPSVDIPDDVVAPDELEHGDRQVHRLVAQARKIMDKDIPILIYGETGSGKEILVRSLHYHSIRSSGPLIAVNCAAIPSELAESQLFGYEKGAFTGASAKGYVGLIRQADGGTLFLDEIGEMPLSLQSRLLRVLQQRVVTPLGSTESYPVDIKLISATNRSLRNDISKGHFRQDLYYRIAGLNVELPALRERTDITPLIRFIHQRLVEDEPGPPLSEDMLDLLARHPWPGNMRQLVHVLKVGLAMADGEPLEEEHLPDDFFADACKPISVKTEPLSELVPRLYRANGGNVSRTARAAGVSRNTVYKYAQQQTGG